MPTNLSDSVSDLPRLPEYIAPIKLISWSRLMSYWFFFAQRKQSLGIIFGDPFRPLATLPLPVHNS
jgi:hypothetical protein